MKKITKIILNDALFFQLMFIFTVILLIGVCFNCKAVITNGGKMPVYASYNYEGDRHFTFQSPEEVNNFLLSDMIDLKLIVISIGDVIILNSILVLMFLTIYRINLKLILKNKTERRLK